MEDEHRRKQELYVQKQTLAFEQWASNASRISFNLSSDPLPRFPVSDMPDYKTRGIFKSTNRDKINSFVVIDTETTGLRARADELLEVAAVRFEDFIPIEYFDSLIKPHKPIPPDATKINHIADVDVASAPPAFSVIPAFKSFLRSSPLIGHNLPFDIKFLYSNGLDFFDTKRVYYDTLELSKKAFKNAFSYSLQSLCQDQRIYSPITHRAYYDCLSTGALFARIIEEITDEEFFDLNYFKKQDSFF